MNVFNLKTIIRFCFLALFFILSSIAWADGPITEIKYAVDEAIKVLSDPQFRGESKDEDRREHLRRIIFPHFDFREMAKRSLAVHWRRRTPEEQEEFVQIFRDLLEKAYGDRIESYSNEKFIYTGEKIEERYAEVNSKVITSKGEEFRIDYRFHRTGNDWRIYDVVVEEISMVNNYRSQFNRVISNSSYENLVSKMRKKLSGNSDK